MTAEPSPAGRPPGPRERDALLAWFARRARSLPWREARTPYRVWVSEVMLQQTRAATVAPYFRRWMERFPDVAALAAAPLDEVLSAWEGLGYYRRARALHDAARRIVADGGRFPRDEAGWRALPGVGPYTAAAVAALTLGARTVAVDGNVRRVGARLAALPAPRPEALRSLLLPLVPAERPGRGSEALIELGATVCTPRAPDCGACPLAPACAGRRGDPLAYPSRRSRAAPPTRRRYARLHLRGGRLWLERRPEEGLLGGMWGPPQEERAPAGRRLAPLHHVYSHFRLELVPVLVEAPPVTPPSDRAGWASGAELDALPLSAVDRALLARLRDAGLLGSEP